MGVSANLAWSYKIDSNLLRTSFVKSHPKIPISITAPLKALLIRECRNKGAKNLFVTQRSLRVIRETKVSTASSWKTINLTRILRLLSTREPKRKRWSKIGMRSNRFRASSWLIIVRGLIHGMKKSKSNSSTSNICSQSWSIPYFKTRPKALK